MIVYEQFDLISSKENPVKKLLLLTLMSFIAGNAFAMPNPASKNCVDKGGKLEIVTEKDGGQVGMCHLPNGVVCEEFALLRKECPATPKPAIAGGYTSVSVNNADVTKTFNVTVTESLSSTKYTVTYGIDSSIYVNSINTLKLSK